MNSKITIEVDFSNNNLPVVRVLHRKSDDVRDSLVSNFIQHLDHTSISRWLRIEYRGERTPDGHVWDLVPISSSLAELEQEAKLMMAMVDSLRKNPDVPAELKS
jgi:hypothetical protein